MELPEKAPKVGGGQAGPMMDQSLSVGRQKIYDDAKAVAPWTYKAVPYLLGEVGDRFQQREVKGTPRRACMLYQLSDHVRCMCTLQLG